MTDRRVTLKREDKIAIVSLNRPARHNAWVPERRLKTERDAFVAQVQTQQALDGIDDFLRRQEHV